MCHKEMPISISLTGRYSCVGRARARMLLIRRRETGVLKERSEWTCSERTSLLITIFKRAKVPRHVDYDHALISLEQQVGLEPGRSMVV